MESTPKTAAERMREYRRRKKEAGIQLSKERYAKEKQTNRVLNVLYPKEGQYRDRLILRQECLKLRVANTQKCKEELFNNYEEHKKEYLHVIVYGQHVECAVFERYNIFGYCRCGPDGQPYTHAHFLLKTTEDVAKTLRTLTSVPERRDQIRTIKIKCMKHLVNVWHYVGCRRATKSNKWKKDEHSHREIITSFPNHQEKQCSYYVTNQMDSIFKEFKYDHPTDCPCTEALAAYLSRRGIPTKPTEKRVPVETDFVKARKRLYVEAFQPSVDVSTKLNTGAGLVTAGAEAFGLDIPKVTTRVADLTSRRKTILSKYNVKAEPVQLKKQ